MKREKDNWIRKEEGEDRSMSVRSWGERRLRGEASALITRALTHTVPLSSDRLYETAKSRIIYHRKGDVRIDASSL